LTALVSAKLILLLKGSTLF